jgi:pilus assembly protein Flp/PilA
MGRATYSNAAPSLIPFRDASHEAVPPAGESRKARRPEVMIRLVSLIQTFSANEKGASLVEYALLLALIAVVALAALGTLGKNASTKLDTVASSIGG